MRPLGLVVDQIGHDLEAGRDFFRELEGEVLEFLEHTVEAKPDDRLVSQGSIWISLD